ncbi:TPA: hypothetical protein RZK18_001828, partial [Campylobacter coli]|nr:hypothetical protein [Campylobacter coli]
SYKNYIILSYLVFDVKEDIEEYIRHITIENRAFRGLELLGRGWKNQHNIKDEWRDKGVVFLLILILKLQNLLLIKKWLLLISL